MDIIGEVIWIKITGKTFLLTIALVSNEVSWVYDHSWILDQKKFFFLKFYADNSNSACGGLEEKRKKKLSVTVWIELSWLNWKIKTEWRVRATEELPGNCVWDLERWVLEWI